MNKQFRIHQANIVIKTIGSHGRRFFYSAVPDRYGEFILDKRGKLRFIDDYTGHAVLMVQGGKWRGFHNGGTCRAIVSELANYIRTGNPMHPGHFGPWPQWRCDGDVWGYGQEAMDAVREIVFQTSAVGSLMEV